MPSWPGGVPTACDIDSLTEEDDDVLLRFKPDWGLEKLRPRSTAYISVLTYTKIMTLAQYETLISFYRFDCKNGSQSFTGTHPRKGTAITAQWVQRPTMKTLQTTLSVHVTINYALLPQVS